MMEFAQGILLDQNRRPIVTFNDLLADGYRKPDTVDELTWEMLADWFGERRIIPNFDKYFKRALKLHFPYYRELLRLDPTVAKYDWFVENYQERFSEDKAAIKSATSGSTTHNEGEVMKSKDENVTHGSSNSTDVNKSSEQNRGIGQARNNPDSAMYQWGDTTDYANYAPTVDGESVPAGIGNGIANPHITNPSATTDQLTLGNGVSKGTNNASYSDSREGSLNRETNRSGSATNSNEQNVNSENVKAEILSGRNNKLSEMIDEARATIIQSESWEWFYKQIDKCFYQCYN